MSVDHLLELSNNGNEQALIGEVMRLARGSDNRHAEVGVKEERRVAAAAD
jgi:hypothetical protein